MCQATTDNAATPGRIEETQPFCGGYGEPSQTGFLEDTDSSPFLHNVFTLQH
jgi:hypothetical protein